MNEKKERRGEGSSEQRRQWWREELEVGDVPGSVEGRDVRDKDVLDVLEEQPAERK